MDTGAIRPYGTIAIDHTPRRDDVAGSHVATDLPTEKTVRAPQASSGGTAADSSDRRSEHPAVKTGFERDLNSGSIVYRWTDQTTERVILEIPRSDRIRSQQSYADQPRPAETDHTVDRSA